MSHLPLLQQTIASTLRVPLESITDSTVNEDLPAWDSLGHVNLMMALEQTFDIYVEVEDFERLVSVPAILAYLESRNPG
jgi:acyl carrier protein